MCVVFVPSLDTERDESHVRSVIGSLSMIFLAKSLDLTCSLPPLGDLHSLLDVESKTLWSL